MKDITPKKAALGIRLTIKNAKRYIKASKILIGKKAYREAFLLLLYAFEEEGRIVLIWNSPFHADSEKLWQRWLKRFRNHDEKFQFSKDLDNFAAGKLAFKSNKKLAARFTKKRVDIAYIDFYNDGFISPKNINKRDVDKMLIVAQKRLLYLKRNHPSLAYDIKNITSGLKELKGRTVEEIKEMFEKRKKGIVV